MHGQESIKRDNEYICQKLFSLGTCNSTLFLQFWEDVGICAAFTFN